MPGPTITELPGNPSGLTANGFYWVGGILLIGALILILTTLRRGRRR